MATVTFRNVSKHFGDVKAVDDVNFETADGEFVCLLGPSGCGKTTTLRLMAGLEDPTEGQILIGDRDVTRTPAKQRDVGMVFQDYALYPHMSIVDNIAYPLKVRGTSASERRERSREVAESLQIGHLLDRKPGQISGGQQQRTSVARAVVHKPKVFLFDEPLSNLDAKLRLEARSFLKHLQRELGVTAVYVTHDQAEAMALADRIVVMESGRVVQMGHPLDVYRRPATTFVASFLGNPPMNLMRVTLERSPKGIALAGDTYRLRPEGRVKDALESFDDGTPLTLGIRPEHLELADSAGPWTAEGELYAVEPLGPESLVTLRLDDAFVTVRLFDDTPPEVSGRVRIGINPDQLHVFREDGSRLELA